CAAPRRRDRAVNFRSDIFAIGARSLVRTVCLQAVISRRIILEADIAHRCREEVTGWIIGAIAALDHIGSKYGAREIRTERASCIAIVIVAAYSVDGVGNDVIRESKVLVRLSTSYKHSVS